MGKDFVKVQTNVIDLRSWLDVPRNDFSRGRNVIPTNEEAVSILSKDNSRAQNETAFMQRGLLGCNLETPLWYFYIQHCRM